MPMSDITEEEEKAAKWSRAKTSGLLVLVGMLFWYFSTAILEDGEEIGAIMLQGVAYMFWVGSIVSAVHSVENALLNSKK